MALKVPCISTRVGAVPDVMVDEVSGLLVNVGDSESMANSLVRLAEDNDLRTRIAEAGFARVFAENRLSTALNKFQGFFQ